MTSKAEVSTVPLSSEPVPVPDRPESDRIIEELDQIVKTAGRKSPFQHLLHHAGAALVRWLDRLVPAQAPRSDPGLPPEIRFPCF